MKIIKKIIPLFVSSLLTVSLPLYSPPFGNVELCTALADEDGDSDTITEYRYRDKSYVDSDEELPEPYVLVDEKMVNGDFGEWSDWTRDAVSPSDTREVATDVRQVPASYTMVSYRTRGNINTVDNDCYRINGIGVNVRTDPGTGSQSLGQTVDKSTVFVADGYSGDWVHAKSVHTNNGVFSGWVSRSYCVPSGDNYVQYRDYSVNGDFASYDLNPTWAGSGEYVAPEFTIPADTLNSLRTVAPGEFATGLRVSDNSYNADGYNKSNQVGYVFEDGYASMIWFVGSVNYSDETWYRFRDRQQHKVYTYCMTSDWSEWSDKPVAEAENREIETRTVPKPEIPDEEKPKDDNSYGSNDNYTFGVDNYNFLNKKEFFNNDYYHISEKFKNYYQSQSNLSFEAIKNMTKVGADGSEKWDGSCYGLSCLEILVKAGKLSTKDICGDADTLYKLPVPKSNEEVESVINFYHLQQYTSSGEKKLRSMLITKSAEERVDEVIKAAEKSQESGNPALLVFDYSVNKGAKLGKCHAVVIFGLEQGEWTIEDSGKTYDRRILISDSNVYGFNDSCCMYFDSNTHEWEIPYYNKGMNYCDSSGTDGNRYAQMKFVTDELWFIDLMGYANNVSGSETETVETNYADISINSSKSSIGNITVSTSSENNGINAPDPDSIEIIYHGGAIGESSDNDGDRTTVNAMLMNETASYEYDAKGIADFDTVLSYPDSKFEADVTNGSFAVYVPDESVSFDGLDSDYTLSAVMNEGLHPTDWYKIEVSGEGADSGKITVSDEGYIFESDSIENGISVKASDRNSEANLDLYSVSDKILIYQADKDRIGVKLDTDDDGVFETKYTPSYLGDANGDSIVSIADAVKLQKYLLKGEETDKKGQIAFDINMDGNVDIFDFVLMRQKVVNNLNG